jgi:hypothetical protein
VLEPTAAFRLRPARLQLAAAARLLLSLARAVRVGWLEQPVCLQLAAAVAMKLPVAGRKNPNALQRLPAMAAPAKAFRASRVHIKA